jgi:nitric oxide reductase NorD protein
MEKVFKQMQKKERDYATGILLDVSGSTNNKINEDDITIDIEKRAAYVLGEATNVLKDKLAIYAFTSDNSRSSAKMYEVKKFEEAWGSHTKGKLGFLEPEGNTPLSIAIRALTKELHNRKEKNKIMYILTDGAPNNLSDTQKAMEEARNKKIYTVYINIDFGEGAKEYFSELAPYASYSTLVKNIEELPEKIFDIYLKRRKI